MTLAYWAGQFARPARHRLARTATAPSPSSTPTPTSWRGPCGAGACGAGDGVALLCANRPEFAEVARPRRSGPGLRLTPINWHLTARGGGLHRRRLRGARRSSPTPASPASPREAAALAPGRRGPARGRRAPSTASSATTRSLGAEDPATTSTTPCSARACSTRRARPAGRRACTGADTPPDERGGPRPLRLPAGRGPPPLHRAAVPRRAARLLARRAAARGRRRRAHGRVGRRGDAAARRGAPGHPHPHGADHVPPAARRCPTTCAASYDISSLRIVIHGAAPCPVPVKQAMIDWVGPVVCEYYAATEGVGHVRRLDDVAGQARHRRAGPLGDTVVVARRRRRADRARRGRHRVPQGAGRPAASSTSRTTEKTALGVPRRLLHARRHGLRRRGRLPVPHRPHRQPHHLRRREHLPGRGRRRAARRTRRSATPRRSASRTTSGARR